LDLQLNIYITMIYGTMNIKNSIFAKRTANVVWRERKLFESHLYNNDVLQMQFTSYKILELENYIKYNSHYLPVRYAL
jgi:hypothetical protein